MAKLVETAQTLGLEYDPQGQLAFGEKRGFHLAIITQQNNNFSLVFSVAKDGQAPVLEELKVLAKDSSELSKASVNGYSVVFLIKTGLTKSKTLDKIEQAIEDAINFFTQNGYTSVCQVTGEPSSTIYLVSNSVFILSDSGFKKLNDDMTDERISHDSTKEQIVPGIVGAFIGSLIGVIVTVIIGQLGYVAVISGIVMGVATVKGYELLGKKISKIGFAITVIIMLAMTYFAYQLNLAITIAKVLEVGWFDAFQYIPYLLESGDLDSSIYYSEMAKLFFFSVLGFVPTLIGVVSNAKTKFQVRKLY